MNKFSELRDREKEFNSKIKLVIEDQQLAIDSYTKDVDEFKQQIAEKKQLLNVTEVESKLKTQLLERQIEGRQSCQDREYSKEETKLTDRINYLQKQLLTEKKVNETIREHLTKKQQELLQKSAAREKLKDERSAEMTAQEQDIS